MAEDCFEQALVPVTMVVPQERRRAEGGGRRAHLGRSGTSGQGCHRSQLIITSLFMEQGPH